jgi:hypothetical protein
MLRSRLACRLLLALGVVALTAGCEDDEPATSSSLAAGAQVEQLSEATLTVHGEQVRVNGQRTDGGTTIEIALPASIRLLGQPALIEGGKGIMPVSAQQTPEGLTASYPRTPVGTELTVDLGSIGYSAAGVETKLTIAIGAAIEDAKADAAGPFAIQAVHVLDGDPALVVGGELGTYSDGSGERAWVAVILHGNWHPEPTPPQATDGAGRPLDLAHVQTGYTRDDEGNVRPGTTSIAVFIDDPQSITLTLPASVTVDSSEHLVTLHPR